MTKSKFFQINDKTRCHTFSLDHVVAVVSYDRCSVRDYSTKIANIIEITLLVGGERQTLVVWFDLDEEKERDAEYRRLNKALTKKNNSQTVH